MATNRTDDSVRLSPGSIVLLVAGMIVTGVCALGAHEVLFDVFLVPPPIYFPKAGIAAYIRLAQTTLGIVLMARLLRGGARGLGAVAPGLIVFILAAMLKQQLFRAPLMQGVVTTAYAYAFLQNVPSLLALAVLACVSVAVAPRLTALWQAGVVALVFAAAVQFAVMPAFGAVYRPFLAGMAYLSHQEVYAQPYGAHVLVPAYLLFAEPTVAAFVLAALAWRRLPRAPASRIAAFTAIVLLETGLLVTPLLYTAYDPHGALDALISAGQYWAEAALLGVLTIAVCLMVLGSQREG